MRNKCHHEGDENPHTAEPALSRSVSPSSSSKSLTPFNFIPLTFIIKVLVFSFMTSRNGRILQVHHDGNNMIIQHTKLFSFTDEETGPIELFLQYYLSQPAGTSTAQRERGWPHVN